MKLETAEDFLKKFDYNYEKRDKALIIDMEFSQKVMVDFSNPESIVMTNKLKGWNFLTGIIPSSIKNAVFLNLVLGIILSLLISLYDTQAGVFFFLGLMFWVLVWFTFYHSKFNNLQQFLMKWMN
ncbi:hypothetical protein ACFSKN_11390 [Mariniflexile gromovii]|uniref:Competence protein n=1 Tax=Mariniflexile gromovii TaxID=362523 RepID=A0ABS4BWQ8_9FLAO|nr:hypothetical protein [Mariniflexile gromovii]MBP0904495.1 hypothetical protein [Mariniflexile gromovii]